MITRSIIFENYRTLGVEGHQFNELCLNQSDLGTLENFGDIVALIGLNNSGKSNIIKGLKALSEDKISKEEAPNFIYDECTPSISLKIYDRDSKTTYIYSPGDNCPDISENNNKQLSSNQTQLKEYIDNEIKDLNPEILNLELLPVSKVPQLDNETFKLFLEDNIDSFEKLHFVKKNNYLERIKELYDLDDDNYSCKNEYVSHIFGEIEEIGENNLLEETLKNIFENVKSDDYDYDDDDYELNDYEESLIKEYKIKYEAVKSISLESILKKYKEFLKNKYSKSINDKIPHYIFKKPEIINLDSLEAFKTENLELKNITLENVEQIIHKEYFFDKLLKLTGKSSINFKKAYEQEQKIQGSIDNLANDINKDLKKISEKFNKLYFNNSTSRIGYNLKLKLEEARILFIIEEDNKPLRLEEQSSGFTWFFNFFFNVLSNKDLKEGTILITDEPASSLHTQSQKELRNFMKKFAIENNITIVYSTHSEHMIDITHLDEIRVITKQERKTEIHNKFTHYNNDSRTEDTTKQIEAALSLDKFYLSKNPYNDTIFVEGITDYNYLNSFENDLNIFPINGVLHKKIKLMNLLKKVPTSKILLDSDNAGNKANDILSKDKDLENRIISIKEVNPTFEAIEDLFCKGDKEKFKLKNKGYYRTINIKNLIFSGKIKFSEETKENFKILLDNISS